MLSVLDELISDQLLFTGITGATETKAADLAQHRSGSSKITKLIPLDFQIREIPGLGILSGPSPEAMEYYEIFGRPPRTTLYGQIVQEAVPGFCELHGGRIPTNDEWDLIAQALGKDASPTSRPSGKVKMKVLPFPSSLFKLISPP